jgi:hypothetical protein
LKYDLGPPVICLDDAMEDNGDALADSHEQLQHELHPWIVATNKESDMPCGAPDVDVDWLAIRIVRVLTAPPTQLSAPVEGSTSSNDDSDDALVEVLRVIRLLAAFKAEVGLEWRDGWDVKHSMTTLLFRNTHPSSRFHIPGGRAALFLGAASERFLLYPAWCVLCVSAAYLLLANFDAHGNSSDRRRRLHALRKLLRRNLPPGAPHQHQLESAVTVAVLAIAGETRQRLPELDRAWGMWRRWGSDVISQMQDDTGPPPSRGEHGYSDGGFAVPPNHLPSVPAGAVSSSGAFRSGDDLAGNIASPPAEAPAGGVGPRSAGVLGRRRNSKAKRH